VIETTSDTDAFQFTTGGGNVSLRANPVKAGPNLAVHATLYDATDRLLVSNNPQTTLWAAISTNLPAGTYTFRVSGAGRNDPLTNGFSAYASLGYYSITGSVANARLPNRFVIPEHAPDGTVVGLLPAANPNHDPPIYTITAGNTYDMFALDNSGTLFVSNSAALDYQTLARDTQLPAQFELFVDIVDAANSALTETNRRVVVAVTNVIEAPMFSGFFNSPSEYVAPVSPNVFQMCTSTKACEASVTDRAPPGTPIGTVVPAEQDFYTRLSFSIVDGKVTRCSASMVDRV
jgi:hypothetical protein